MVRNLSVNTGSSYQLKRSVDSIGPRGMGAAWVDWPYVLQRTIPAGPGNPLYLIKTAIADTGATNDPILTFDINRCATVDVIFGEKEGEGNPPPYPAFTADFRCSLRPGGQPIATFFHETNGESDQVRGPTCRGVFPAGTVSLGPRQPSGAESKMYTVFIYGAACP